MYARISHLTVGRKLALSFALLGVLLAGLLAVALSGMANMSSQHHAAADVVVPRQISADLARSAAADMHFSQTQYALVGREGREDYEGDRKAFGDALDALAKRATTARDRASLAQVRAALARFDAGDRQLWAAVRAGDPARANAVVTGVEDEAADALGEALTRFQQTAGAELQARTRTFVAGERSARRLMGLAAAVTALVGIMLAALLGRSIGRGARSMLVAARGLSRGDVNQRVEVRSHDELGDMADAFHEMIAYNGEMASAAGRIAAGDLTVEVVPKGPDDVLGHAFVAMIDSLGGLIGDVAASAGKLGSASHDVATTSDEAGRAVGEIASAVTDVANGAEHQVRMVESTREAVNEAALAAASSAEAARLTAGAAEHASEVTRGGVAAAESARSAIREIAGASSEVGAAIADLSERSGRIGTIVHTITDIAEQTNLLALNAAIEAARAGEQGRGFAVVADEVRKLAEESQTAAGQIAALIGEIQSETARVVGVVGESARLTDDGVATVERTREAFEDIGQAVEDMGSRIAGIAAGVEEITAATQRVEHDIGEVAAVAEQSSASAEQVSASTQETSASTQEIAASAQDLAATAERLNALVRRFTVAAG